MGWLTCVARQDSGMGMGWKDQHFPEMTQPLASLGSRSCPPPPQLPTSRARTPLPAALHAGQGGQSPRRCRSPTHTARRGLGSHSPAGRRSLVGGRRRGLPGMATRGLWTGANGVPSPQPQPQILRGCGPGFFLRPGVSLAPKSGRLQAFPKNSREHCADIHTRASVPSSK